MANQERFREIHEILTEFPELHRQNFWEESDQEKTNSCGTTRCIAGWAVWGEARRLGLLSRKRDLTDRQILESLAERHDIHPDQSSDDLYEQLGTLILGLTEEEADSLFWDMNRVRVADRVASFAATGEDISGEVYASY